MNHRFGLLFMQTFFFNQLVINIWSHWFLFGVWVRNWTEHCRMKHGIFYQYAFNYITRKSCVENSWILRKYLSACWGSKCGFTLQNYSERRMVRVLMFKWRTPKQSVGHPCAPRVATIVFKVMSCGTCIIIIISFKYHLYIIYIYVYHLYIIYISFIYHL